jgi:hypothetical protein
MTTPRPSCCPAPPPGRSSTRRFSTTAGRHGFTPKACRPYRARTKGKVERSIGYVRDRFFVGRTFTDLPDLDGQLAAWLSGVANVRAHKTTGERPADRLTRERLAPLPAACVTPPPVSRRPGRPSFRFAAVEVATRPLTVYEEVCA